MPNYLGIVLILKEIINVINILLMNILEVKNVTKQYANHKALNDVSLNVPEGKVFGLLGPNGAGKTTLIRIINQITAPDTGEVFFKGSRLASHHVEHIGYLPEERGLYRKMKVGEQAVYLAKLKGLNKTEATKKLKEWFEKFDILDWWDKKVEELSKGMQQKIQFIVTILHKPELLIFDEPFSGFDPINANLLKREILNLKNEGTSIIFSTHNMSSVEEICDEIALINKSQKILEGAVDEVKERFSGNDFEFTYAGNFDQTSSFLSEHFQVLDHKQGTANNYAKIALAENQMGNELLQQMIPKVNIVSFNKIMPTMDNVFIKVVEDWNAHL